MTADQLFEAGLKPVPKDRSLPVIGRTFEFLSNPVKAVRKLRARYGDVYQVRTFMLDVIQLYGPDANEFVLMDRDQNFSSKHGWEPILKRLFPNGLMLMDFDHHRAQRRIMGAAFKPGPMRGYMAAMQARIHGYIDDWGRRGRFRYYDAIKTMSLELATDVFLGLEPGGDSERINAALSAMVDASLGIVRLPIPGSKMYKGVKARQFMVDFLTRLIPQRRDGNGSDLFTHLCRAEDENGNRYSDQEIVDHMIFLWMAAHDTITSSTTTLLYELGRSPEWQDRLRAECMDLGAPDRALDYDDLGKMVLTEYAFKEALRINPPVPSFARRVVRDVSYGGYHIPKGSYVGVSMVQTHRDQRLWPDPLRFDPMRFSPEGGVKTRHKFAWIPFGGGAHMCIGLHFAYMQAKLIMHYLLPRYDVVLDPGYTTEFQIMPLIKPKDGLPLTLLKRS